MTNGEYIEKMVEQNEDFCIFTDYAAGTVTIEVSLGWWNKPKAESEENEPRRYVAKVITRGNCMICGKELTEGLFFCKNCQSKQNAESEGKE